MLRTFYGSQAISYAMIVNPIFFPMRSELPEHVAVSPDTPIVVLLVDRDADTRYMYGQLLRHAGYDVDEAADGHVALAKAISRHPAVIITETRLAGISGVELCRLIRQDHSMRNTRVLFVTGDAFSEDVRTALGAGADAVLLKPCLPERVAAEVERLLEAARSQSGQTAVRQLGATHRSDLETASAGKKRMILSRTHARGETFTPPNPPPSVVCPVCDQPLQYVKSYIGGVSARHPEQWDYFNCPGGCGQFQYRHRTRALRRVS
jgi:CheY-like chemotaxis protein